MEFIALLSGGKGTWGQVAGLINRGNWEKVILICNEFFKDMVKNFEFSKKAEIITINFDGTIKEVVDKIIDKLKNKIEGTEVALSIASGDGKEHMALISALLRIPVGVKFVVLTKDGILEL